MYPPLLMSVMVKRRSSAEFINVFYKVLEKSICMKNLANIWNISKVSYLTLNVVQPMKILVRFAKFWKKKSTIHCRYIIWNNHPLKSANSVSVSGTNGISRWSETCKIGRNGVYIGGQRGVRGWPPYTSSTTLGVDVDFCAGRAKYIRGEKL